MDKNKLKEHLLSSKNNNLDKTVADEIFSWNGSGTIVTSGKPGQVLVQDSCGKCMWIGGIDENRD